MALTALLFLPGCTIKGTMDWIFGRNYITEAIDPAFSYNVVRLPWWWPDEDTFDIHTPEGKAQKAYYKEHGKPEFIRLLYNTPGTVLPPAAVSIISGPPSPRSTSWVYTERKVEATFSVKGVEEKPLNDEVATICERGDPDEIKDLSKDSKLRVVRYIYRARGDMIDFQDSKKTSERTEKPMPGWKRSSN